MIDPEKLSPDKQETYWRDAAKISADRMIKLLNLNVPDNILESELAILSKRIQAIIKARKRHN